MNEEALFSTYSIVGRCLRTGEMGAAIASATPAVGSICVWLRAGIGAVCTQSWTNPHLGPAVLNMLAKGNSARQAATVALSADRQLERRQLGVIGASLKAFAWTGSECTGWHGHRAESTFSAQGNMLTGPEVIDAMSDSFRTANTALSLDERLLSALEAGQAVGGDIRGRQSAALATVANRPWNKVDLRVDEHGDPVAELRRIHTIAVSQWFPFEQVLPELDGSSNQPSPDEHAQILLPPPERKGGGGSHKP